MYVLDERPISIPHFLRPEGRKGAQGCTTSPTDRPTDVIGDEGWAPPAAKINANPAPPPFRVSPQQ